MFYLFKGDYRVKAFFKRQLPKPNRIFPVLMRFRHLRGEPLNPKTPGGRDLMGSTLVALGQHRSFLGCRSTFLEPKPQKYVK